ncbi:hypothetical protein [Xanthomonas arboricola]|uniref:hypothetical protein n=1 Tax=Xanthomonas arboricola TaxID=56448 RepID=UPI0011B0EBE3|nr:hypothetical protein [Xanthomonas arboricola]
MTSKLKKHLYSLILALTIVGTAQAAQNPHLHTTFGGWIGKNQKSFYEDAGTPAVCYGDEAHCPTSTRSTTRGSCRDQGFDIGASWDLPVRIPGLSLSGNYNRSWTECNERAEENSCPPKAHSKYSPAVLVGERWGLSHVTGSNSGWFQNGSCEAGWKKTYRGGSNWRCDYVGGSYDKTGYLPEFRYVGCEYDPV